MKSTSLLLHHLISAPRSHGSIQIVDLGVCAITIVLAFWKHRHRHSIALYKVGIQPIILRVVSQQARYAGFTFLVQSVCIIPQHALPVIGYNGFAVTCVLQQIRHVLFVPASQDLLVNVRELTGLGDFHRPHLDAVLTDHHLLWRRQQRARPQVNQQILRLNAPVIERCIARYTQGVIPADCARRLVDKSTGRSVCEVFEDFFDRRNPRCIDVFSRTDPLQRIWPPVRHTPFTTPAKCRECCLATCPGCSERH